MTKVLFHGSIKSFRGRFNDLISIWANYQTATRW